MNLGQKPRPSVTVKNITMIKTNDRESLSTPQILDQFNSSPNIVVRKDKHQERMLYEDIGLEYKFCLNVLEDCQKIIGDEKMVK